VIDLSVKVINTCKHLTETTKDAPKDLRQIFVEISSLKAALESLKFLSDVDSEFSDTLRSLHGVEGAVRGCRNAVEELAKELYPSRVGTKWKICSGNGLRLEPKERASCSVEHQLCSLCRPICTRKQ
jgi:hypothetical protein